MRMTKNKRQVLEALNFTRDWDKLHPPYTATSVQGILKDDLGYGDFDMPNLTRTLKALVDQGLVKKKKGAAEIDCQSGCIDTGYDFFQVRWEYWPADMDLEVFRTPALSDEEYAARLDAFCAKLCAM